MARPKKNNADYFSHDATMRNDAKIIALRSAFGNEGYAVWCMLLETLCGAENFVYKLDDISMELLAGDFRVSVEFLEKIIDYCQKIGLLQRKNRTLSCKKLVDRLKPMCDKREYMRQKYQDKVVSEAKTKVSEAESTQSKVKESKVKKRIYTYKQTFEFFWKEYPKKKERKVCEDYWVKTLKPSNELARKIIEAVRAYKKSDEWREDRFIVWPIRFLKNRRWEDEITTTKKKPSFVKIS